MAKTLIDQRVRLELALEKVAAECGFEMIAQPLISYISRARICAIKRAMSNPTRQQMRKKLDVDNILKEMRENVNHVG